MSRKKLTEEEKIVKKRKPKIENFEHIASNSNKKWTEKSKYQAIYTLTSVSKHPGVDSRTWAIYSSLKKAIEEGIFSWSGAEVYYESGYYHYIVIEKNPLNCP